MTNTHPLDGARLRFARAEKHLEEARELIAEFAGDCKDHLVADADGRVVRLDGWPPIPSMLPLAVSDAVHNMRAALDHVVYQLAINDSRTPQKQTQFIIADTREAFDGACKSRLAGLTPAHVKMIEAFQPYSGVEWIADLRNISNPDKHQALTSLTSTERTISVALKPSDSGTFGPTDIRRADGSFYSSRYDLDVYAFDTIAIAPSGPGDLSLMTRLAKIQHGLLTVISHFDGELG